MIGEGFTKREATSPAPDLEVGSRGATDVASEVTLTEEERASITRCIEEHGGVCREVMCDESLDETVRLIVAARLAESEVEVARLRDTLARVEALAEDWRYKGEFGMGPWQEGHGPDFEGYVLDQAAIDLRAALAGGDQ